MKLKKENIIQNDRTGRYANYKCEYPSDDPFNK